MHIQALQIGERIDIKKFLQENKLSLLSEEPYSFCWGESAYVVLFKYGVVILWNFEDGERNRFLSKLMPFVAQALQDPFVEEAEWKKGAKYSVEDGVIKSPNLSDENRLLVSVTLARTIVLDFFESRVENLLIQSREKISHFTKSWAILSRERRLLNLASEAMLINNATVTQMALMDKPDFVWEDQELDQFYLILEKEYELSERFAVMQKKLDILLHDSEFIMNYLESQKSNFLEWAIVLLFVFDIVLIIIEAFV